jgi:hypothetical protein
MTAADRMEGACLCGAVRIVVEGAPAPDISACHCSLCRRWSGAAFWGFEAPVEAVTVEGPATTYDSSSFAERAFCASCGTHLWFRDHGAPYELVPGLFEALGRAPLAREVYADRALACARLAGDHPRVTAAAYEAAHNHV